MPVIRYCDNTKCRKQIAGWDNEYGQVMTIDITVKSDDRGNSGAPDGTYHFCSAKCAQPLIDKCVEREENWIDVWARGKILGVAPVMPKKKERS
jgi:hypothetical protein